MAEASPSRRPGRLTSVLLWVFALLIAAAIMYYQRRTGPTYELRGTCTVGDQTIDYRLIRTHETTGAARVTIPAWKADAAGVLRYRRYPTSETFTEVTLARGRIGKDGKIDPNGKADEKLYADLPAQPAAGKLEYHLVLAAATGPVRIPSGADDHVIIRFKDPVPDTALFAHVVVMILAILVGVRTGLAALFTPSRYRRFAWFTFLCLTAGGLVLGPIVQKHAFGAYWTGVPYGWDLTDNKTLVMWVVWLLALLVVRFRAREREFFPRLAMITALIVMLAVYVVPHSLRGSELDYSKLDRGVDPKDAIGTSED